LIQVKVINENYPVCHASGAFYISSNDTSKKGKNKNSFLPVTSCL
jgi:hypothetical protein